MAEVKSANTQKKSWFRGLKSEFNKIIWTDRDTLIKQTIAVVAVTTIVALLIIAIDGVAIDLVDMIIE